MVTVVVTSLLAHPALAGIVYVTVYVPAVLPVGVIAPVEASISKPAGVALKLPPVYAFVPVKVIACAVAKLSQ